MTFGVKELLMVFDEIPQIFRRRAQSSLFKSTLVQDLDKSLALPSHVLVKIFDILLREYPRFFNIIQHASGDIIQVQKKFYN